MDKTVDMNSRCKICDCKHGEHYTTYDKNYNACSNNDSETLHPYCFGCACDNEKEAH